MYVGNDLDNNVMLDIWLVYHKLFDRNAPVGGEGGTAGTVDEYMARAAMNSKKIIIMTVGISNHLENGHFIFYIY